MTPQTQTILFTDVVGSTELLGRRSVRAAEQLRMVHFEMLREQIEHRAGREIKNLGDGLVAAFDGAQNAIEAAVAIQRAAARHPGCSSEEAIAIRIGVSSGDVRIEAGDCFGAAVVEASRLCQRADGGQVLLAESTRLLARDYAPIAEVGELQLKGMLAPTKTWEARWSPDTASRVRAVLADDVVLMREGIAHVLESAGIEVVGQAGDAEELLRLTAALRPDLAIVDVRMPPTHTDEGLRAAARIRLDYPATGVLLLTVDVQPKYATRLLEVSETGVGYLLKNRVSDTREFAAAARRVADGGTAFEPGVITADQASSALDRSVA